MGVVLAGILFLLLSNPRKEEVLVCEVRASFQGRIEMNFQSEGELEYLDACVGEGLRFYTPTSSAIPYLALASGMTVDGVFVSCQNESAASCWPPPCVLIPFPQSAVSVHPYSYSALHAKSIPKNPEKVVPERWLGYPEYASNDRGVSRPVGYGTSSCLRKVICTLYSRTINTGY